MKETHFWHLKFLLYASFQSQLQALLDSFTRILVRVEKRLKFEVPVFLLIAGLLSTKQKVKYCLSYY